MWQYLVKRSALLIFTLLGICVLSFFIVTLAPGDPTYAALGLGGEGKGKHQSQSLDQVIEHTRRALYLDRPAIVNFSPNTRRKVAHELAGKICDGTDSQRESALKGDLQGEVGTAALDVLIEEAPARAAKATASRKDLEDLAAKLEAVADRPPAEVDAAISPLEARFSGRGPRFSKKATPGERARIWAGWVRERAAESTAGVTALLGILETLVPVANGGIAPRGTLVERASAWSEWWQKNASHFSGDVSASAVQAYMKAGDADRAARLEDVKKIGGAAVPEIMSAYQGASGADRSHAAFALSEVAHKPWDLTIKPEQRAVYEREWGEKKAKLEKDHAAGLLEDSVFETRVAELGTTAEYVARTTAREFDNQERNIARWWFRSEESFVDFSIPRQLARAVTQTQFGNWFRSLVLGLDLGQSYTFKKDVAELIKERLPVTLWLNFFSIILTYTIAIPLGIFSATHQRSTSDRVLTIVLFLLYSLPSFWVGSILILLLTDPGDLIHAGSLLRASVAVALALVAGVTAFSGRETPKSAPRWFGAALALGAAWVVLPTALTTVLAALVLAGFGVLIARNARVSGSPARPIAGLVAGGAATVVLALARNVALGQPASTVFPQLVVWFPSHGMSSMNAENLSPFRWLLDVLWHLTLPTVCLTYGGIAAISRFMRAGMLEVVRQDYIRTARAKGLAENVIIFKHALRNSLIPILTLLAYLLPSMFGGSIIIESIFSIEGLGKLMFEAILNRDYPVIMAEVFISGLLTLLGILFADISYAIVDPRIELK